MSKILAGLLAACLCSVATAAERMVLLITPSGVYQSTVVDGIPGPWASIDADVIVHGFTPGGGDTPKPPVPPTDDPVVEKVKSAAVANLKDKPEGIAVASLIDALQKLNLPADKFTEAIDMAAPIADASMQANGRITAFFKAALAITQDPAKLKVGVQSAFGISAATLETIRSEAARPQGSDVSDTALDFAAIIAMIQMIIQLLKSLGII
mgnify:CR=1 FL=1|tara:strand:- start:1985 stop:2614 length:630 start_codon:yes stop_codon:yes gene_type:complete